MSSGGTTQSSVQNKDPWAQAQPYLTDIMAQSQGLYNSGAGTGVYSGQRVAGLDPATMTGLGQIGSTANATAGTASQPYNYALQQLGNNRLTQAYNAPLTSLANVYTGQTGIGTGGYFGDLSSRFLTQNQGANNVLGGLATNQGFNSLSGQALGQNQDVSGMLSGAMSRPSLSTGGLFGQVAQGAAGPTSSAQNLGGMASGADAGKNPYLMDMLEANSARIANRVNSSVAGMGRYGSGGHTDVLTRSLAEATNPILAQAYESDRNRMLQASGQIDSSQRAADATRLGALQGMTGVEQGNFSNMLGAGGQLAGMLQSDLGLGGSLFGQGANLNMNAANSLGASNRGDTAGALGAIQGMTGVQGQNISNQMGAANSAIGTLNAGQGNAAQWGGMLPGLNTMQYSPGMQNLMAGGLLQNQQQSQLDASRQMYGEQQNAPWTALNRYLGGVSGLGNIIGQSGTVTGSAETQQQTPWTQYLGLGLAGLGMMPKPTGW